MDQWAKTVAVLSIHCAWCRRIARYLIRGEPLTEKERQHITSHVTAILDSMKNQAKEGQAADPEADQGTKTIWSKGTDKTSAPPHGGRAV